MKTWMRAGALALVLGLLSTAAMAASTPVIYGYREGLAQARQDGLWGFANTAGEIVVPIQYDSVTDFNLGIARVEKNHKLGLVRQDGIELLPTRYDTLTNIGYGLYLAQEGDLWGVVSLLAYHDGSGEKTHDFFPVAYDAARLDTRSGQEVLVLTQSGVETVVPLSSLPGRMMEKGIPSAQFPLIKGVLPSFSDVGPRDWYALWVDLAYNLGLMEGVGGNRFAPEEILTVGEVVKLAAFLESQSMEDDFHLQSLTSKPWYSSCVAYCLATGILKSGEFDDYERAVTRAEMVRILAATTLARSLPTVNPPERVRAEVPDVSAGDYAADAIWGFYTKGLLQGTDGVLTFSPEGHLTRAEAAAVVSRMARAEQRVLLWPEAAAQTGGAEEPPAA